MSRSRSLLGNLTAPVGELCARAPVTVAADARAGNVARIMERERVGSVLVVDDDAPSLPVGIVTDRDLRGKVLARDRGPEVPVAEIMSSPVTTLDADAARVEALWTLLQHDIHHLPVVRDGTVIGVVTHADLVRHHRSSPGALHKKIVRAPRAAELVSYADDVADMVRTLHRNRLPSTEIGRLVAALGDTLVERLLSDAETDLGPPPCPYAWIAFGSEGRREQSLLTDQDNALVYERASPEAERYFRELGERVVNDLAGVGIPLCEGGYMASRWCKPLEDWRRIFRGWIESPEPEALLKASIFFDFRRLHGELDLEPLEEVVRGAADRRLFLAHMARMAISMGPPLGFWNRVREGPDGVDLKAAVLMPVAGMARLLALEAGDRHGSTVARLRAAERAGKLSEEGAEALVEAFRFVFDLRLRRHLDAHRRGEPMHNRVRTKTLSAGDRRRLKEAFLTVDRRQKALGQRFGTALMG